MIGFFFNFVKKRINRCALNVCVSCSLSFCVFSFHLAFHSVYGFLIHQTRLHAEVFFLERVMLVLRCYHEHLLVRWKSPPFLRTLNYLNILIGVVTNILQQSKENLLNPRQILLSLTHKFVNHARKRAPRINFHSLFKAHPL